MRSRSIYIMTLGFTILVVLLGVLGIGAVRRAGRIYREMEATQDAYLKTEAFRRDIVADMYLADILVRDYLLDPSPQNANEHREQLLTIRSSLQERMDNLPNLLGHENSPRVQRLQSEVQGYWESLDPLFDWTTSDKAEKSWTFLRKKVFPRRQAVVSLAREIARANRETLEKEQQRIRESQQNFKAFLVRMLGFTLLSGVLVAVITSSRVLKLEREHDLQRQRIEQAENDLRRLSRRLVESQEIERKALSRELHDEVGQMLTALGMELASVPKSGQVDPGAFIERVEEAKRLNGEAMRSLRDLAMGLRPSMLDDLGLEPALRWQGREFSRHTGVPADVEVQGRLDGLSDAERTCIYRVVQEALTNCARHSKAKHVRVKLDATESSIAVEVLDDGIGFIDSNGAKGTGLGLIGMRERVEALGGQLRINTARGKGAAVIAVIPKPQEVGVA